MSEQPPDLYDVRFGAEEALAKDRIWREIVAYLAKWIDPTAPVLDVACDRGHFIRFATGSERWATDIRDVGASLPADVRFVQGSGLDLATLVPKGHFGTVFMSNYLEHLPSPQAVVDQYVTTTYQGSGLDSGDIKLGFNIERRFGRRRQ